MRQHVRHLRSQPAVEQSGERENLGPGSDDAPRQLMGADVRRKQRNQDGYIRCKARVGTKQMSKLGSILKDARLKKEMTLEDLSLKCGYSKALISRIENDSVSPSITSLARISAALDEGLHEVFASLDPEEPVIVRKEERRNFSRIEEGQDIEFLTEGTLAREMQPLLISSRNRSAGAGAFVAHNGEEFLHVLQGKAEMTIGDRTFFLNPGDSIHFRSSIPHTIRGLGKEPTVSLKVAHPPYF